MTCGRRSRPAISRLQNEYYGEGATRAKAYIAHDMVSLVLEETFTTAERTLIERGESESIRAIRRHFQHTMGDEFKSSVEQATGRVVRAFLSETNVVRDYLAQTADGRPMPMFNVFHRDDSSIRHFWGSELLYAPTDAGQGPRHNGTLEPMWNLFDLIPECRHDDWDEQLTYSCAPPKLDSRAAARAVRPDWSS